MRPSASARTFANVLDLMERYPDLVFAASSAQQYAWIRDHYPDLYARIRRRIREGRFVPVGGMWVEADTNLPGGEALVRQFVAGKSFWLHEFGIDTREAWLPDSFGFSAALPQIIAATGTEFFLTQKMSWNDTNRLPHHTFLWEGIDGTQVFTHLPPADTYNSDLSAVDLERAERQHAERGISDVSLVPFGYGDGGGGPTREMIEEGRRKADLEGAPRVTFGRPDRFFREARASMSAPAVWSGELYLEFHRGTYTSQARTKQGNRRCEHLLHEAELWATTAAVRAGAPYPAQVLRSAWETVLLQQFHDILPGSSIAWVHQEAERNYAAVARSLEDVIAAATRALQTNEDATGGDEFAFNAAPVAVAGVAAMSANRVIRAGRNASAAQGGAVLESDHLRAQVAPDGTITHLIDVASGRDATPPDGRSNVLQLFRDTPTQWDAWDLDPHYQQTRLDRVHPRGFAVDGDAIVVEHDVGSSRVRQRLTLSPDGRALDIETSVDWRERQKLLKLAFAFDVHAASAASEIQFGHLRRPIHTNTSWELARFETVAHRWVHVDEPGFGVTVANDRTYGHDVTRRRRPGGGTFTVVRQSLLRAPRFPDPEADQGEHVFTTSVSVGGLLDAVAEGYRLNLPLRPAGQPMEPLLRLVGDRALILQTVKLAEDGTDDVIARVYEAHGGRARGILVPSFDVLRARHVDLLERPVAGDRDPLRLDLRPFELVTIRLSRVCVGH